MVLSRCVLSSEAGGRGSVSVVTPDGLDQVRGTVYPYDSEAIAAIPGAIARKRL